MIPVPAPPPTIGERLDQRVVTRLKALVTAIGVAGILTGGMVLRGYALHQPLLTTVYPGLRAMSVMTATALCLLAAGLLAAQLRGRRLGYLLNGGVLALTACVLISHAVYRAEVISPGLARSLFGYDPELAGRTSVATAAVLSLIACALLLKLHSRAAGTRLPDACAGVGLVVAGMAVISYAYAFRTSTLLYALRAPSDHAGS